MHPQPDSADRESADNTNEADWAMWIDLGGEG